jgi:hypothetical protein
LFALPGCDEESCFEPIDTTGVFLSPDSTAIRPGGQVTFNATVGRLDAGLKWYVNDVKGGDFIFGTITPEGLYTAPLFIPEDPVVVVKAVSVADSSYYAVAVVRIVASVGVEMEDYSSFEGIGVHVTTCSAASGARAVDGCDSTNDALYFEVTFDHSGKYSAVLRAAATKLAHRYLRATLIEAGPEGGDQVTDFDIEGKGIG